MIINHVTNVVSEIFFIVFHVSIKVANIAKHVCPCNTHFNYQGKIY